jgi:hypothetical protein
MLVRAHERVLNILGQPFKYRSPDSSVTRIKQYVRDYARHLKVDVPEWAS